MSGNFRYILTIFVLIRNTYFNGQAVTYDEIGNPITFGSKSFVRLELLLWLQMMLQESVLLMISCLDR